MTNDQLFIDVLAQIEAHPETWDQYVWVGQTDCGTAFCMAGWAAHLTGAVHSKSGASVRTERGGWERLWHRAEDVLGLPRNHEQSLGRYLFAGRNTLDDLYSISAELMGIDVQVLRDKVADQVAPHAVDPLSALGVPS